MAGHQFEGCLEISLTCFIALVILHFQVVHTSVVVETCLFGCIPDCFVVVPDSLVVIPECLLNHSSQVESHCVLGCYLHTLRAILKSFFVVGEFIVSQTPSIVMIAIFTAQLNRFSVVF